MKKLLTISIPLALALALLFSTPSVQNGAAATQAPTSYPPFPTATAYAPETPSSDSFVDEISGFSITTPARVTATVTEGSGNLQEYEFGNTELFGFLFTVPVNPAGLEASGKDARDGQIIGLEDIKYLADEQITTRSGLPAWYSRFTGYVTDYDYTIEVRAYTFIVNQQGICLMIYSLPENFSGWENIITQMLDSVETSTPQVLGFPRSQVLILEGGESQNPRENDPATTHSAGDTLVFNGLVTFGPNGSLAPDLADDWELSADGLVYTFHLRPTASFHNGRPLTAADIVYSWERAADPALNSDTVLTYLGDIVGVKEMHAGEAAHISGLEQVDEHTLRVTIDAPKAYFLQKLTYPTAFVVDRENIAQREDWYRTPNGAGPYRLVRWEPMVKQVYQRYAGYTGWMPAIPNIVVTLYTGEGIRLYESGSIDLTGIGSYNLGRVTDPADPLNAELHASVSLCTYYIQFDTTRPPFDDPLVRKAFSLAIDRQKLVEVVMRNAALPAKGIYPPAIPGYSLSLQGQQYDPEAAKEMLASSSYGSAKKLPPIIYTDSGYGSAANADAAAMLQMWQQNLGVTVTVQNMDPEIATDEISAGHHGQLVSGGWCADYPDPENFTDVLFHSDAGMNYGGYSNPEFDRLVEAARVETDVTARMELYAQAEQFLVDDSAAIFLMHPLDLTLVKPYVLGYANNPLSTFPQLRYLALDRSYWK